MESIRIIIKRAILQKIVLNFQKTSISLGNFHTVTDNDKKIMKIPYIKYLI